MSVHAARSQRVGVGRPKLARILRHIRNLKSVYKLNTGGEAAKYGLILVPAPPQDGGALFFVFGVHMGLVLVSPTLPTTLYTTAPQRSRVPNPKTV